MLEQFLKRTRLESFDSVQSTPYFAFQFGNDNLASLRLKDSNFTSSTEVY